MIRVLSMLLNDVSDRGVGFDGVPVEECSGYFGFAGLIPVGHDGEPFVKVVGDVDVDASAGHTFNGGCWFSFCNHLTSFGTLVSGPNARYVPSAESQPQSRASIIRRRLLTLPM